MNFTKQDVLAACAKYGPLLTVPDGLDGVRVMAAIASNESTFGMYCGPRHESAFDTGGQWCVGYQLSLVQQYGSAAACSYGPWQMLFANFSAADLPTVEAGTLDMFAQEFLWHFNAYVMGCRKPTSLDEIGMVWNAGHVLTNPGPGVLAYCRKLAAAYNALATQ